MHYQNLLTQSPAFAAVAKKSHAYLFFGNDSLAIQGLMRLQAARLLCEQDNKPCQICDSCLHTLQDKHSDVKLISKDKLAVADIDTLLQSLLLTAFGKLKIYLIPNFDRATPQAQNKLLKSIEEPPPSVVFILGATVLSGQSFGATASVGVLPTISSRCVLQEVRPFSHSELKKSFVSKYNDDDNLQLALSLSQGCLTKVEQFLQDDSHKDSFCIAINLLKSLKSSQDLADTSKILIDNKDNLIQILEYISFVLRDVLAYSCARPDLVLSKAYSRDIVEIARLYNQSAILSILPKMGLSLYRISTYGNTNSIVDQFLFMLLECKYNNRASLTK